MASRLLIAALWNVLVLITAAAAPGAEPEATDLVEMAKQRFQLDKLNEGAEGGAALKLFTSAAGGAVADFITGDQKGGY